MTKHSLVSPSVVNSLLINIVVVSSRLKTPGIGE